MPHKTSNHVCTSNFDTVDNKIDNFVHISLSNISIIAKRIFSQDSQAETDKVVLDKVLNDDRTAAYATTIDDINRKWLDCKECNWYKSQQTILSEARVQI